MRWDDERPPRWESVAILIAVTPLLLMLSWLWLVIILSLPV